MKKEIMERIKELGGAVENSKGDSLQDTLLSITFPTVLYPKMEEDIFWEHEDDDEPIYGIEDFIQENKDLATTDQQTLFNKIEEKYFQITEEGYGQMFWIAEPFTPFKEGSTDFEEWNSIFMDDDVDLTKVMKLTNDKKPDFILLFHSYGFPDHYFICLSDPNQENPTIFGTDHEVYFREITHEGNLEDFFNNFMTKDELFELIKKRIQTL